MRAAGAAQEKSNSRPCPVCHATLWDVSILKSSVHGVLILNVTEGSRTRMQRSLQPDSWFHPQCPQNISGQGR